MGNHLESSAVSIGDQATAAQYNSLRTDVLNMLFGAPGRLTLTTATPITTSDVTAAEVLYYTPVDGMGDRIALYDGTRFQLYDLSEISIKATDDAQTGDTTNGSAIITDLTDTSQLVVGMVVSGTGIPAGAVIDSIDDATQVTLDQNATADGADVALTFKLPADTNYDVFCFQNSGTPKLELLAWTDATTRATALTTSDAILVKTGAVSRRYLGTIRTTATDGQLEDSLKARLVWNINQQFRPFLVNEASNTASWTYASTTVRPWNNDTDNRVEFIIGLDVVFVSLEFRGMVEPESTANGMLGIGLDATDTTHSVIYQFARHDDRDTVPLVTIYEGYPGAGYHYLQLLEYNHANNSVTFRGTDAPKWKGGARGGFLG